ncbi:MAG TPA: hypothetical protein DIC19_00695 [Erysipelotrichaceae bacterium]|nr:hypothetical protein [Erysipelotrichaceae bacterium]
MQKQFIFVILISIVVAIFALTNADVMTVRLFFWTYQLSGSLVILISVALGALLVLVFGLYKSVKTQFTLRNLNNEIKTLKSSQEALNTSNASYQQEIERLKAEVNTLQNTAAQKPVVIEKTEL